MSIVIWNIGIIISKATTLLPLERWRNVAVKAAHSQPILPVKNTGHGNITCVGRRQLRVHLELHMVRFQRRRTIRFQKLAYHVSNDDTEHFGVTFGSLRLNGPFSVRSTYVGDV